MLETSLVRTIKWAEEKGILEHGNVLSQGLKTNEECHELMDAILRESKTDVADAIGDIFVTIVIQAELQGLNFTTCVNDVLDIIEQRTGKMENGMFIKEE